MKDCGLLEQNYEQAEVFFERYSKELDSQCLETLESFIGLKKETFFQKRKTMIEKRFFKQGLLKNLAVFLFETSCKPKDD